jgi:hypothetical protein
MSARSFCILTAIGYCMILLDLQSASTPKPRIWELLLSYGNTCAAIAAVLLIHHALRRDWLSFRASSEGIPFVEEVFLYDKTAVYLTNKGLGPLCLQSVDVAGKGRSFDYFDSPRYNDYGSVKPYIDGIVRHRACPRNGYWLSPGETFIVYELSHPNNQNVIRVIPNTAKALRNMTVGCMLQVSYKQSHTATSGLGCDTIVFGLEGKSYNDVE